LTREGELPDGLKLDLTAAESGPRWREALFGCTAVIHCAAHVHRPIETEAEKELFGLVNVAGTAKLLAAALQAGVSRFVLVSSAAVYDWSKEGPMNEDAALRPVTAYAKSKLEAESLVRSSTLDWRIGRLATVFGRGDTANFRRLALALKARRFVIPGQGNSCKSVLSASQAGELLGRLATQQEGSRIVLNLASPLAPSLREICTAFSRRCGFANAPMAPLWLLRGGAFLGDGLRVLGVPAPLDTNLLAKLTTPTVLDVSAMLQMFPDITWTEFEETLEPAADYYAAG
jgi:nucleoside-diphosphate-sugar epimerase